RPIGANFRTVVILFFLAGKRIHQLRHKLYDGFPGGLIVLAHGGTSFHSISLGFASGLVVGKFVASETTLFASLISSSDTAFGRQLETSSPSDARPLLTDGATASSGLVPRETARYGRPFSAANLLKCAAAITLLAAPCSHTNTMVEEFTSFGVC